MLGEKGEKNKCPFAADTSMNPHQLSHKVLELSNALQYTKSEYQKGIKKLYDLMKFCLSTNQDRDSILKEGNKLLNENLSIVNKVDAFYDDNYEVTHQIIAGLGHAVRTITSIRDVYRELGGLVNNTKDGSRKVIYQLATIGLYDLPLSGARLKTNSDIYMPIKDLPYDKNKFFINKDNILQIKEGFIEDLLGKGRCPAIGAKMEEENILIIDDMIDRLVG